MNAAHTNPRVSIMVPVFNRADLLRPCLDSVLAQTMGDPLRLGHRAQSLGSVMRL